MNDFAKTLRYLRNQNALTQEQMAEKLKVSVTQYSNYEQGMNFPHIEKLNVLSELFNVPIDYLLKGEKSLYMDFATAALFKKLREMDDDKKQAIFFVANQLAELKDND